LHLVGVFAVRIVTFYALCS